MDLLRSLPLKKSDKSFWILGILVDPPTKTISSIELLSILASRKAFSTGSSVPLNKSAQSSSNLALVMEV